MLRLSLNPAFDAVRLVNLMVRVRPKGLPGKILAKFVQLQLISRYASHISPLARIGEGLQLPHPVGIVIGDGAVIGNNVTLYQHVTLGRAGKDDAYPVLADGVTVYTGATIIGRITIGKGAVVAAHAVVNQDVPDGMLAAGVPARIIAPTTR